MGKGEIRNKIKFKTVAVIPAAGAGVRMGVDRAKQYFAIGGKPLLAVTLEKFQMCPSIHSIVLVSPPGDSLLRR